MVRHTDLFSDLTGARCCIRGIQGAGDAGQGAGEVDKIAALSIGANECAFGTPLMKPFQILHRPMSIHAAAQLCDMAHRSAMHLIPNLLMAVIPQ